MGSLHTSLHSTVDFDTGSVLLGDEPRRSKIETVDDQNVSIGQRNVNGNMLTPGTTPIRYYLVDTGASREEPPKSTIRASI